jgi:hydrogenase nickel incorporation protein HypA/HybF
MHELSICGSIADIVKEHAAQRRVDRIHVRVGQLRQIVPDTLVYCWSLVSADTELDGTELVIERVPAQLHCDDCGHTSSIADIPIFACHACASVRVSVLTGEEFMIASLDLAEV